ncbi:hypothetical protein DICSQDRAFT_181878 [Dichomitus squalens LYAD-421 SS1]|uniref:C2H2-type domain-containing protein n=1 Tax=Dichomitus squalens (strain LYAD-421) TaxID=732165 RepID=R7SUD8_DICSQ|nr:uncharacterized protein DICSQDRAFT_181878 [Dichomitus squalens LYAD-421 SS1]EJF59533.1 hypothetical protein DICSQDRAFT_181878 [Dichomitus squalens LYAD-421 SS1]
MLQPQGDAATELSTSYMRPRTRSQTKAARSRPTSKRKGSGDDNLKLPRPTKLPRTDSSEDVSDYCRDTPSDYACNSSSEVPRSMLVSFRVAPSPFQMYDGASRTSSVTDATYLDTQRFVASGPEPMFEYSWRVMFKKAYTPTEETGSPVITPQSTVCAVACLSGANSPSTSLSVPPPSRRTNKRADENVPPVSLTPLSQLVDISGRSTPRNAAKADPFPLHPLANTQSGLPLAIKRHSPSLGFQHVVGSTWSEEYLTNSTARLSASRIPRAFSDLPYGSFPPTGFHPIPESLATSSPPSTEQSTASVSMPWCTLFDNLKQGKGDSEQGKKRRRTTAVVHESTEDLPCAQSSAIDVNNDEDEEMVHPCPLCPRNFSLPNSLAIHLKWHWGASTLEWKRGIMKNGKGLEKALSEAEERRRHASTAQAGQQEIDNSAPPSPLSPSLPTCASPDDRTTRPPVIKEDESQDTSILDSTYPFAMPVFSQSSFNIFDLPFCASSDASMFEFDDSTGVLPPDMMGSFLFPELALLPGEGAPSTLNAADASTAPLCEFGGEMMNLTLEHEYGSAVDTPIAAEDVESGSSSLWSPDLFGCDEDVDEDRDAEGEEDLEDLFGAQEGFEAYVGTERLGNQGADYEIAPATTHEGADHVRSTLRISDQRIVASSQDVLTDNCTRRDRSTRASLEDGGRPVAVHAPRLTPLDLPPPQLGDHNDDSGSAEHINDEERELLAALAPLSDLIALPSPPSELDVLDQLSLS